MSKINVGCVPLNIFRIMHSRLVILFIGVIVLGGILFSGGSRSTLTADAAKTDFVIINEFIPSIKTEIIYASENNVYGKKLYEYDIAYLRKGTAEKLQAAQEEFNKYGYTIKVWDAYRPPSAQFKLWEICPDVRYVANPHKGYSNHSRGSTVDVTLIDQYGINIDMPSGFDDFSVRADRNYNDVSQTQASNARLLETIMLKHGFVGLASEWWHFDDSEKDLYNPAEQVMLPQVKNIRAFMDWGPGYYKPGWLIYNAEGREYVDKAVNQGLISGHVKGNKRYLHLSRDITRAEFAVLLSRVLNLNNSMNYFGNWYGGYVAALLNANIIDDASNGSDVDWNNSITRMEMTGWIGQALLLNGYQPIPSSSRSGLSRPDIDAALSAGIIHGDNGGLALENNADRLQAVIATIRLQEALKLVPLQGNNVEDGKTFNAGGIEPNRSITISAVGDCTLGNDLTYSYSGSFNQAFDVQNDYAYFFNQVKSVLGSDDFTIANLESTLTNATQLANKDHQEAAYFFKGAPAFVNILKLGSIEAVNVANNHSFDYLEQGYKDTINNLHSAGIIYFGNNYKKVATVKDIDIGLLGYNQLGPLEEGTDINLIKQQVSNDIVKMKESCDLVVVSFHWGVENARHPSSQQIDLGRYAIDSGADLVLGHHPHVIQDVEKYNGKYIVYSLANFCFGGNSNPSDKDTFIFQQTFVFNDKGVSTDSSQIKLIPCSISSVPYRNDFRPSILSGVDEQRVLNKVGL